MSEKDTKKPSPKKKKSKKESVDQNTQDNMDKYMPYLEEMQGKLFQVIIVFFAAGLIGGIYYQQILRFVMGLFNLSGINIVMTSPYQFISLAVNTGISVGLTAALIPLTIHFLNFIKPALQPHEHKLVISLIPSSIFLFFIGFGFGVWVVQFVVTLFSKTTLEFEIGNLWDIGGFFSQILLTGVLLAIVFQLPIVVTALIRFRIVKYHLLVKQRRYVYALLLLIAALMPPTDVLSLILLTVPPLLLFEIALVLNHPSRLPHLKGGDADVS
ncbi:twin-arginine translocase subunit TatC [Patescibacteria group bacterium]